MLDVQEARRSPLTYLAWALGLIWFWGVVASFVAVRAFDVGDVAGFGARLYAPLAIAPAVLIGLLAMRCFRVHTRFGRAILLTVVGLVIFALADLYYLVVEGEGSLTIADVGYLMAPLLWCVAILQLWRAAGVDWRDAHRFTPYLVGLIALLGLLAMPTVHLVGVPIGANLLHLGDVGRAEGTLSLVYLLIDALLLHAVIVLWRRSFGFAPYRRLAIASALLCVADIVYSNRIANGTYELAADPSDFLYFGAIGALMLAIASFELHARAEHRQRDELLELAKARRAARDTPAVDGTESA